MKIKALFLSVLAIVSTHAQQGVRPLNLPSGTLADTSTLIIDSTEGVRKVTAAELRAFMAGAVTNGAANFLSYGAVAGGNCDVPFAAFLASSAREVVIPKGTFILTNDATLSAGYRMRFENGAALSIASGKTLTVSGVIDAGNYQIFSGSGSVAFTTSSPNTYANAMWFGAIDSLTRSDDSLAAFNKAIAAVPSAAAARGMFVYAPGGHYWFSAGMTVPGHLDLRGESPETTILRFTPSASGTLLAVGGNGELRLRDLQFLNDPAATTTNNAVSIGNASSALSKLEARNVSFRQWTANAIALTNVGYAKFFECNFNNNQNSASFGGTATTIARAVFLGGSAVLGNGSYVTGIRFISCRFSGNDQTTDIQYAASVVYEGCWIEGEGTRLTTSAPSNIRLGVVQVGGFKFTGNYVEGNWNATNEAFLRLDNIIGAEITGNSFGNHFGGTQRGNSAIILSNRCEGIVINGNAFSGTKDKFIKNYSNSLILAWPNSWDSAAGLGGTLTNYSQITPFLEGTNYIAFATADAGVIHP